MSVCSCHVTYAFQNESKLCSCLNVKGLLARIRHEIWSLSDCNWTRTHNHLVRKQILSHLSKLASLSKWLSVRFWTKWLWVWVQLQSQTFYYYYQFVLICFQISQYKITMTDLITGYIAAVGNITSSLKLGSHRKNKLIICFNESSVKMIKILFILS